MKLISYQYTCACGSGPHQVTDQKGGPIRAKCDACRRKRDNAHTCRKRKERYHALRGAGATASMANLGARLNQTDYEEMLMQLQEGVRACAE
jgi:hypothetical protein